MEIWYRSFLETDCDEVINLWSQIEGIYLHSNGEDSVEGIKAYLDKNPGFSFVAEHQSHIIGAVLCGHDGRRGFIHHLAVHRNYQRKNIGKTLLTMSLEQLKKANILKTLLFVLKSNKEAEAFYQHLNWQEENIVKVYSQIL